MHCCLAATYSLHVDGDSPNPTLRIKQFTRSSVTRKRQNSDDLDQNCCPWKTIFRKRLWGNGENFFPNPLI